MATNPSASNGLVALVGIVFGAVVTAIVTYAPLDSGRPQEKQVAPPPPEGLQHLNSRLWEDPFAVMSRRDPGDAATGKNKGQAPVDLKGLCASVRALKPTPQQLLLVPVMISNAPYPDAGEQRMRTRFAVQAAMAVAHFAPFDYEHIGQLSHESMEMPFELFKRKAGQESRDQDQLKTSSDADTATQPGKRARNKAGGEKSLYALVLWIGEEALLQGKDGAVAPLRKIHALADAVARQCGAETETAVLGPARSDTLRAMITELDCDSQKNCPTRQTYQVGGKQTSLTIYSPFATASGIDLLQLNDIPRNPCDTQNWLNHDWKSQLAVNARRSGSVISDYFKGCGINFFSTIATDQELGVVLARELRRRDPQGRGLASDKYHVALISEWDTYYGRVLPKAVMRGAGEKIEGDCEDDPLELPTEAAVKGKKKGDKPVCTVLRFTYMRGLDGGIAPGAAAQRSEGSSADKKTASAERAEGGQQFDYLRRLSERIKTTDAYLRHSGKGWILSHVGHYADDQVRAIGILGVDVYDKISILRALRKDFPDAVFFTTDLDARLLHPRDIEWTRNMVVASSFGFALADCVQKGIPPFRGVYQTSAYLSARLALYNAFNNKRAGRGVLCPEDPAGQALFDEPHERSGPKGKNTGYVVGQDTIDVWLAKPRVFELGLSQAWDLSRDASEAALSGGVGDVHPAVAEFVPGKPMLALAVSLLILTCFGLYLVPPVQRTLKWAGYFLEPVCRSNGGAWRRRLLVAVLLLIVLIIEGLMLCAYLESDAHRGEPFAWVEGISMWPSELVRNLALVLTYVFLFSVCGRLDKSNAELRGWAASPSAPRLTWWQCLAGSLPDPRNPKTSEGDFLDAYADISGARWSFCRALLGTLVFWGIGILLMEQFGYPPLPVRGQYAAQLDQFLVLVLVPSFLMLLFFAVDATRNCERFSNLLCAREKPGTWNADALKLPIQPGPNSNELLVPVNDALAMTRMVAIRTSAIGPMVYFPFVVLGLLVLARWSRFDNWGFSIGLVVTLAASFVIACIAAALLQRAATRVRDRAVAELELCLLKRRGRDDKSEPTEKQIDQLIGAVKSLREGAFVPILEQPAVVASLFPFATAFLPKVGELLGMLH